MGWTSMWKNLKAGKFGDAFSYAFIGEDDIARDREVDAKLRELNDRNLAMGIWSEADYRQANENLARSSIDRLLTQEESSPWGGFKEGAAEGAASMRKAASGVLGTGLSIVPWWVWVAGVGVAAWYVWQNFLRKP